MADGFVLIEFNTEGKGRVKTQDGSPELRYFDFRLEGLDLGMDDAYGYLQYQLPADLKDVLIMAFFNYKSVSVGGNDYWTQEYEDNLVLESHVIVKQDYKKFYYQMVVEELNAGIAGYHKLLLLSDEKEKVYYKKLIQHWEEFYDEDFQPELAQLGTETQMK